MSLKHKPPTRRDQLDAVRLKKAGDPAHINEREAALLAREMPAAQGPVIGTGLLAEAGRRGDTLVTDINRAEAKLLKRHGGSGTRNPATGLLEFEDGMGGSDNPGGGHDASAAGSPGSSGGYGPGTGTTDSNGNYSSNYSAGVGFGAPTGGLSYGGISNFGGIGQPGAGTIGPGGDMSNFAGQIGALTDAGIEAGYAPPDTLARLVQTYLYGPPPSYKAQVPGRFGAPTGRGPGIVGQAARSFGGPMMGGLMNLGMHMDQAMSPETRAASLSANQAQGSKNSTGQDNVSGRGSQAAGAASGAETAGALAQDLRASAPGNTATAPPGYTVNPAGQVIPLPEGGGTLTGLPQPVQNLLLDYIWSGRRGGGLLA